MPTLPFPIQGTVRDSNNNLLTSINVTLINTTQSSNELVVTTDSNGKYFTDAANFNTGYNSGDEVTVTAETEFKDESKTETFTISGDSKTQNITTEVLTELPDETQGHHTKIIPVNLSGEPFQSSNPLPVQISEIDLMYNPNHSWTITRSDGQPDYEEVTIKGVTYRRTFTYNASGFMTARSKWVKR